MTKLIPKNINGTLSDGSIIKKLDDGTFAEATSADITALGGGGGGGGSTISGEIAGEDVLQNDSLFLEKVGNSVGGIENQTHGVPSGSFTSITTSDFFGIVFVPNRDIFLTSVTKHPQATATRLRITGSDILPVFENFVGDVATLSDRLVLKKGISYLIAADNNGASYASRNSSISLVSPVATTLGEFSSGGFRNIMSFDGISSNGTSGRQNIGANVNNTRVNTRQISKGGVLADFKIVLDKAGSPSTDCVIELYQNDLTGSPIGTATIDNTNIENYPQEFIVTRDSAFTYPDAGTVVFYVLKQTADTVNSSNYYRIYYDHRNTTTRLIGFYDGSVRSNTPTEFGVVENNGRTDATGNSGSGAYSLSINFIPNVPIYITTLYVQSMSGSGNWILNGPGYDNVNVPYSGNLVTINGFFGIGQTYTLSGGPTITRRSSAGTNTGNFMTSSFSGGPSNGYIFSAQIASGSMISFPYIESDNIHNTLISKTSALYPYKISPDNSRTAIQNYSIGQEVTSVYKGPVQYTGLLDNTVYYASNIPGMISAAASTNRYVIGETDNNGNIILGRGYDYYVSAGILNSSQSGVGVTISSVYRPLQNQLITGQWFVSGVTGSSDVSSYLQSSPDGINGRQTIYNLYIGTAGSITREFSQLLSSKLYYRSVLSVYSSGSCSFGIINTTKV